LRSTILVGSGAMALREVPTQRWCGTDDLMPAYNLEVFLAPKRSGSIHVARITGIQGIGPRQEHSLKSSQL
jgi:hypothetical protein